MIDFNRIQSLLVRPFPFDILDFQSSFPLLTIEESEAGIGDIRHFHLVDHALAGGVIIGGQEVLLDRAL